MNAKKLLFPTDFSSDNEAAFQFAQSLTAESGGLLYVAHVDELNDLDPRMTQATFLFASALGGNDRREVRDRLKKVTPTHSASFANTAICAAPRSKKFSNLQKEKESI